LSLFEQFSNSLWNFRSYRSLSQTKGGKSFLYIFLLFLVIYLIGSIFTGVQANNFIDSLQSSMADNVPDFKLANGSFTFEGEMPYRIEDNGFLMIIDTTGQTTLEDFKEVSNGILITEKDITTISFESTDVTSFSMMGPLEISKDQIIGLLPSLKVLFVIIMAIGFLFTFAGKLFGILMLTLIAMIATSIFNKRLSFSNQWNIAIYASTLPMLVKLANSLTGGPLNGYMFLIYWGLAITWVFLGIYNMPSPNQTQPPVMEQADPNPQAE
jgi:hypothetical protein